nr:unnamed protein product [Callosobruchus chinensis]
MNESKRKLKTCLLKNYFKKARPVESELESEQPITTTLSVQHDEGSLIPVPSSSCDSSANSSHTDISVNGIGYYVDMKQDKIPEETKFLQFQKIWIPDEFHKFPASGTRNLKFQLRWLQKWTWLAYSAKFDGAFCKYCVFFSNYYGVVGKQPLGKLVKAPFNTWKDAVEVFSRHSTLEYHKFSVLRAESRLSIVENKTESIEIMLNSKLREQVQSNREKLIPIIETIIFCGRQGLSLRGHRDCGPLYFDDGEPVENDGNFRALLRLRVKSGDEILRKHLTEASRKANYISPRIQNELINSCNAIIVNTLIKKVNASRSFCILADETADISGVEQLSLCVRYLDNETSNIREDFVQFVPVHDVTGKGLANSIMETLTKLGINSLYMVGQGYDGAAAMSGQFQGVQQHIREKNDLAIYVHCASHSLNLAISDACEISSIRNCFGSIGSIYNFFNTPKRQTALEKAIDDLESETSATRLKQLCPTRWIQCHESVLVFLELQQAIINALESISLWSDKTTSSTAVQLLAVLNSGEFQISLYVIAKIFAVTLPLSRQLQTKNLDLSLAMQLATDVENVLAAMRTTAEQHFNDIFEEVSRFCKKMDIEVATPRRTGRQTNRGNVMKEKPVDYYRTSIFIPFLENISTQIQERLLKHKNILASFRCLFPDRGSKFDESHEKDARILLTRYQSILNCGIEEGLGEIKMWWCRLNGVDEDPYPKCATDFFRQCNANIFPSVNKLIKIFCTLRVTTATNE